MSSPTPSSQEFYEAARKVIPGGVSSPVRAFKHVGVDPVYFSRAKGPYLYDVDGKAYVDLCLSFGPHILGHSDPEVVGAIQAQAERATSYGACHPLEVELAQWILKAYPFLGKVRLVNSGTEAVMTAIRIARGATARPKILKFEGCYHGHSDGLLAKAGSGVAELSEATSAGVPASIVSETIMARYDDLSSIKSAFESHPKDIAAVILEAIPANHGLWIPPYEHVKKIVQLAREHAALVIFDEVITGFRVGLGGASGFYDLCPDLVTLGKVIGGGLPVAAVVGRNELMDLLAPLGPVYQAGTLSGNPLGAAAGIAVLKKLFNSRPDLYQFDKRCEAFAAKLSEILSAWGKVQIRSLGSMFWIHFGEESTQFPPEISEESAATYKRLFKAALQEGIYLPPSPYEVAFLSFAHTPVVLAETLEKFGRCIEK